jgi:O-Antigen ligase
MRNLLAAGIGFSCLLPGVSIVTVAGVGVQPILPLIVSYCIVFPLANLRVPPHPAIWVIVNATGFAISYAFASAPAAGASYAILQSFYFAAAGLGFGALLTVPAHRLAFVNGYLGASLLSSLAGIIQAVLTQATGLPLFLANNGNFSLDSAVGRAAAFTPESSILAGLLLPALACVWLERNHRSSPVASLLRSQGAFALLCAGLLATRSSMLLAAPAVLTLAALFASPDWRAFFVSAGRILIIAGAAGLVFMPLYSARVEGANDAGWSRAWRILKIQTGLQIFEENLVLGSGPGYLSDPANFSRHLKIPREMHWIRDPQKGVDSTPVRILAEGGILGFLFVYYPLILFWRKMRSLACRAEFRPLFSLCLPLLFAQTVALGYRDLIILLLPSVACALAGDVVLARDRAGPCAPVGRAGAEDDARHSTPPMLPRSPAALPRAR